MALGMEYAKKCNADLLLATDPDCDRCGTAVPDGISLTWRQSDTEKLIFVQNFGDSAAAVQLDQPYENVLSGETVSGSLNIEKYGFAVLAKQI